MNDTQTLRGFDLHITLAMALTLVEDVVNRFGRDHTPAPNGAEAGCVYLNVDGYRITPVCIVGQVFADLGILRVFARPNYESGGPGVCDFSGSLYAARSTLSQYGVTMADDAFQFLRNAQAEQDGGGTWGDAFDVAVDRSLNDLGVSARTPVDLLREHALASA